MVCVIVTVQHRSGYHTGDEDSKEQRGTNEEEVGVHCRVMATVGSLTEFVEEDGDLVDDIESLECFFLANDITDQGAQEVEAHPQSGYTKKTGRYTSQRW